MQLSTKVNTRLMYNEQVTEYNGQRVTGTCNGIPFTGTIERIRPNRSVYRSGFGWVTVRTDDGHTVTVEPELCEIE